MDHKDFLSHLNDNLTTKPVEELKNKLFSSGMYREVASGKVKLLTVVQSLQGVLTNESISIRQKGIEFLSWLLSQLSNEVFNCFEINVLVNFYCDCLKGHHNYIPPAVSGLLELVKMKQITKDDLAKIIVNLFQEVYCQGQLQPDRIKIYSILEFIVKNYLEDVREMGPNFVFGMISFIDGESDPYCLIIIFKFLPILLRDFNLGDFDEDMFEILSCYFPIDLNTIAEENISVTREDLAESLQQCLSASRSISEQSIPLILEKADSAFKNAKLDSYKLLKECCKTLRVENLTKHMNELWKCLSKDVLPGNEKEVCEAGLSALTEVIHLLSKDGSHQEIFSTFMNEVLMTVRSLANRVDENMFQPAMRVLVAAATCSKPATIRVLCHLKTFIQQESFITPMEKKIILSSLLPFLKLCKEYRIAECQEYEEISSYMELINLYLNSASSDDYEIRNLAFLGILELPPGSSHEVQKRVFEIVTENITSRMDIKTSEAFTLVWRNLAQHHQSDFYLFIMKKFSANDAEPGFSNFMWALSLIADFPKLTHFVIPFFINVIYSKDKLIAALESLRNACRLAKKNEVINFFHMAHSDHNIIDRLIFWYLEFEPKEELRRGETLALLSEIIALFVRYHHFDIQQSIADKVTSLFLAEPGGCEGLTSEKKSLTDVQILEAVLGSVRPEVTIPMIRPLREKLTEMALNSTDDAVRLSSSRLLATFVNKSEEVLALDLLSEISKDIFAGLEEGSDGRTKLNSCFLFILMVKGLVLRGGHPFDEWVSNWFVLLGRNDVGEAVAEGLLTVIEEDNLYLNLESHCNIRVLYRQRLFGSYPKLLPLYEKSDCSVKMNYLLALVHLFQGVPVHLIKMEIPNVIMIFAHCLEADKPQVLVTSLEILVALLESREAIFSDFIQSFVPKFLKLAKFDGLMKVRINALRCLYFCGFYPTIILVPLKNQVIRDLEISLDDKKRLVRKEAVRARCRWFLVDSPGEDILDS